MRAWTIVLALLTAGCARQEPATGPAPPSQTGAEILVDERRGRIGRRRS